jgi:hypothetical protein
MVMELTKLLARLAAWIVTLAVVGIQDTNLGS